MDAAAHIRTLIVRWADTVLADVVMLDPEGNEFCVA